MRAAWIGLVAAGATALAAALAPRGGAGPTVQPIAFDHARHHEEDLACADCHATAASTPYAGFPRLATCLACHAEPQGESPEEAKVREFAERKEEIPWVRANRVAGHVYFSHAVHVTLAEMDCSACHGDMTVAREPVTASQIDHLSMEACMACHDERGASNDCLACHK